jgi:hypothetical protein
MTQLLVCMYLHIISVIKNIPYFNGNILKFYILKLSHNFAFSVLFDFGVLYFLYL